MAILPYVVTIWVDWHRLFSFERLVGICRGTCTWDGVWGDSYVSNDKNKNVVVIMMMMI
jgi:hypothetical protein